MHLILRVRKCPNCPQGSVVIDSAPLQHEDNARALPSLIAAQQHHRPEISRGALPRRAQSPGSRERTHAGIDHQNIALCDRAGRGTRQVAQLGEGPIDALALRCAFDRASHGSRERRKQALQFVELECSRQLRRRQAHLAAERQLGETQKNSRP